MLDARVITPTAEDFPDPYDKTSAASVEKLFGRVCSYMRVDRRTLEFEIFPDETEELREILPYWRGGSGKHAAGLYMHECRSESRTRATTDGAEVSSPSGVLSSEIPSWQQSPMNLDM
jgi:hypothetical protein